MTFAIALLLIMIQIAPRDLDCPEAVRSPHPAQQTGGDQLRAARRPGQRANPWCSPAAEVPFQSWGSLTARTESAGTRRVRTEGWKWHLRDAWVCAGRSSCRMWTWGGKRRFLGFFRGISGVFVHA